MKSIVSKEMAMAMIVSVFFIVLGINAHALASDSQDEVFLRPTAQSGEVIEIVGNTITIRGSVDEDQKKRDQEKRLERMKKGKTLVFEELKRGVYSNYDSKTISEGQYKNMVRKFSDQATPEELETYEQFVRDKEEEAMKERELEMQEAEKAVADEKSNKAGKIRDEVDEVKNTLEGVNQPQGEK